MEEDNDNTAAENSKNGPGLLIALVAIATLVAIWLVPGENKDSNSATSEPVASKAESPSLLTPEDKSPAKASAQQIDNTATMPPTAEQPSGTVARTLITELRQQSPLDLDRAFAAAQQHLKNGDLVDAYLLYFFAAREGHGPAALSLAQQADPAHITENSVFEKADAIQANKWYEKALEAGESSAEQALSTLRTTIENSAKQGDAHAQRMMLQWN